MIVKAIQHLHDLHNFEWLHKGKKFKLEKKEYSEIKLELFMTSPIDTSRFILVEEVTTANNCDTLERLGLKINFK